MMHDSSCGCPDCDNFHPGRFDHVGNAAAPAPQAELGTCYYNSVEHTRDTHGPRFPCQKFVPTGAAPAETAQRIVTPEYDFKIDKTAAEAISETAGEMTPEQFRMFIPMQTWTDEQVEAYAKQRVEQAQREREGERDDARRQVRWLTMQTERLSVACGKTETDNAELRAKVADLDRERDQVLKPEVCVENKGLEVGRPSGEQASKSVSPTCCLSEEVTSLRKEAEENNLMFAEADRREFELTQRAEAAEAKVEQLCGDVKAMQKDYSDAQAKLKEMREALREWRDDTAMGGLTSTTAIRAHIERLLADQ